MKKLIPVFSVLALTACGGISEITPDMQAATEKKLPAIDSKGGQLCIFRVSNAIGMAVICDMYANDEFIGRLSNRSYFCVNLSPDEYTITGKCFGGSRVGAEVNIRQGQRKYMELSGGPVLQSQTREVGLSGIHGVMN